MLPLTRIGPSGRQYVLVLTSEFPLGRMIVLGGQPIVQVVPLLTALLVEGGFCWWLARHITTPVLQLRAATQHLADGQLTTRVGRLVTRRHDELADLGQHFNQMAARLEALLTSQQLLFRNVSHELRSPLARVQVALGLLRQHTGAEAARYLERIEREVDRLNRLIGQLLTLARLESGVEVAQGEVCDLRALVQEVVADGDFEAQARQGAVMLVSAEACCVSGTTELLRSAIENVVRNAVRYTTAGTTTDVRVYGHGAPEARHAVIEVRDHGPGVPEEELAHLFQPFYRLAQARTPQPGGAGLGRAITERVVQIHRGTLAAANAPGGGLLVRIQLPMLTAPPPS
jgi:two-component system sensor histidine kinase CpxA